MKISISSSSAEYIITNYIGLPLFIGGVLGEVLNVTVFLSLRTFRQSSCAFYLTIMSVMNIGQLLAVVLPRVMTNLFRFDGTEFSLFYCKLRPYFFQLTTIYSLACFCLATFDQYCATCSRLRWQQWCNIKLAKRLVIANIITWFLHGIPCLILFEHIKSPNTNLTICTTTNFGFIEYRSYVITPIFVGFLPVVIATVFGLMAYRTVHLVRRELDKQLNKMVFI